MKTKLKYLIWTIIIMAIGLLLLKYAPMWIYGQDILFDASFHIIGTFLVLYLIYLILIKKSWLTYYLIFSSTILIIIAFQRILSYNHNYIGVLLGFAVSLIAIFLPRYKELK